MDALARTLQGGDGMIYCDNCPYKPYCIARLNDRTITGCNLPLYWSGLISKGDVVIEHTVKGVTE